MSSTPVLLIFFYKFQHPLHFYLSTSGHIDSIESSLNYNKGH
jgi:hypothetical protein